MENKIKPITVLMAVYNERLDFLKKSIESVLGQTFSNFEFLIVNDGSTDVACVDLLKKYSEKDVRIRLISKKENEGLTKTLNYGLEKAQGKYIARMDSDDISNVNRLKKQFEFMESNPEYALCGSWANIINDSDQIIGQKKFSTDSENIRRKILFFNFFTHSSLFFKRDVILKEKGYNEKIKKAQDYDLILKLTAKYAVANIPEFLCSLRINPKSISSKNKKKQEWYGLIARWKAISQYGFSKTDFWKIIPAVFYFLFVPYFIEKIIFKFLWKK